MAVLPRKTCVRCGQTKSLRAFYKHPSTRDKRDSVCKKCSKARAKELYQASRAFKQAQQRAYRGTTAGFLVHAAGSIAYRARQLSVRSTVTAKDLQAKLRAHGGRCAYCGVKLTRAPGPQQLNFDHQIPLVKGGTNTPSNVVPACRKCNSEKRTRTPKQWVVRWYYFQEVL